MAVNKFTPALSPAKGPFILARSATLRGPVMPRPIWKGAITFGMISIPVKLFGATESKDLAFNTLHNSCKSRLKQKRWCPVDDREVFQDEVVRAYEYSKDHYIEITDEDLEKADVEHSKTIQIMEFVSEKRSIPCTSTSPTISSPKRSAPSRTRCCYEL